MQAQKLIEAERTRIDKHKKLRAKQLEIEETLRVRQLCAERNRSVRERNFKYRLKEEREDKQLEFDRYNNKCAEKYAKV